MAFAKSNPDIRAHGHMVVDCEKVVVVPRYADNWGLCEVADEIERYIENLVTRREHLKFVSIDMKLAPLNHNEMWFLWQLVRIGTVSSHLVHPVDLSLQHAAAMLRYFDDYPDYSKAYDTLASLEQRQLVFAIGESYHSDGPILLPLIFRGATDELFVAPSDS